MEGEINMKKIVLIFTGWIIIIATVFLSFYNRSITEYHKIDPITGEEYGEMGFYTDWTKMAWYLAGVTVVYCVTCFVVLHLRKKKSATLDEAKKK